MTTPKFANRAAAKQGCYYSRRHETRAPQDTARRAWETKSTRNAARIARKQEGK